MPADLAQQMYIGTYNNIAGGQENHYYHSPVSIANPHEAGSPISLQRLKPTFMDASDRTECLPGTRAAVLQRIYDWTAQHNARQTVFWLYALAGAGKSTLSNTIARRFRERGSLGAFLFFDRDAADRSDPSTVIRTMAYQLGCVNPRIGVIISEAIDAYPDIHLSPIRIQFQKLITGPLSVNGGSDSQRPIIFVVDGLDECGNSKKREALLELFAEQTSSLPSNVRFVITSRPDRDIYNALHHRKHVLNQELDTTSASTHSDVSTYLQYRLLRIKRNSPLIYVGEDWPSEYEIQKLTERASGLFVWASTASEFIDGYDPKLRMQLILRGSAGSGAEQALDVLYRIALDIAGDWSDPCFVADFTALLGVVLTARRPLSAESIDSLNSDNDSRPCSHMVSFLGSVLQSKPVVRLLHPSFADFLMDASRSGRNIWYFDHAIHNRVFAMRCLHRLDTVLERNMLSLTLSTYPMAVQTLSEDVSYMCIFWIDHLCAVENRSEDVTEYLYLFLRRHLLHWLECMSILKRSRDSIQDLENLKIWIDDHPISAKGTHFSTLSKLLYDACRFARIFASSIEKHPLFVYTALPFTPIGTTLYRLFHDPRHYPTISGGFQISWSPLQLMISHTHSITSCAFSPDGARIVSGSKDKSVTVWDAIRGAAIFPALRGHTEGVSAVAYSPNGLLIASGSLDSTIRLWDAVTGGPLLPDNPLVHNSGVLSLAFSPDSTRIVSGSRDNTIRIWFVVSGSLAAPPLCGHTNYVESVSWSPDGTQIVSGSSDGSIRLWDSGTGVEVMDPLMSRAPVWSVALSPYEDRVISSSSENIVTSWDMTDDGRILPDLQGHENCVPAVAFSPDGSTVATGSHDKTVRIWHAVSGLEAMPTLRGHHNSVLCVAYSYDGRKVVSGSKDKTIRVWDVSEDSRGPDYLPAFRQNAAEEGHLDRISNIAISADRKLVASGSFDKTIRVWNVSSGQQQLPQLLGHHGMILQVSFSPNGTTLLSRSLNDHNRREADIRLWDLETGAQILSYLGSYHETIHSVAFSLDGQYVVSTFRNQVNHIWTIDTGRRVYLMDAPDIFATEESLVVEHRHVLDSQNGLIITKLPDIVETTVFASSGSLMVVGTAAGQVIIMKFPDSLWESSESAYASTHEG